MAPSPCHRGAATRPRLQVPPPEEAFALGAAGRSPRGPKNAVVDARGVSREPPQATHEVLVGLDAPWSPQKCFCPGGEDEGAHVGPGVRRPPLRSTRPFVRSVHPPIGSVCLPTDLRVHPSDLYVHPSDLHIHPSDLCVSHQIYVSTHQIYMSTHQICVSHQIYVSTQEIYVSTHQLCMSPISSACLPSDLRVHPSDLHVHPSDLCPSSDLHL